MTRQDLINNSESPVTNNGFAILVIDDDHSVGQAIITTLESADYAAHRCESPITALELLKDEQFDLIICDLKMPQMDGLTFIREALRAGCVANIILMTAFGNTELAIQALRAGAYDYIPKPFSAEELLLTVKKVEEKARLKQENSALKSQISQKYNFSNIIAASESMVEIFDIIRRLSSFNTTVLVVGESGTGKELIARAIHHNSPRRGKPFVAINCGAIPENLIESELFGHKRGSFTDAIRDKVGLFELANGGTLFLDEIGELPAHLQVKLLRVLQEQKIRRVGDEETFSVDVRVVAATLRDLESDVIDGRFREDLYYRLNVVSIPVPPLRDRPKDIPLLVNHFIKKHNSRLGLNITGLSADALKALIVYNWRGNVRELENVIERAMVLADATEIVVQDLPKQLLAPPPSELLENVQLSDEILSIKEHTRQIEIKLIKKALEKTKGNRTQAAKVLEISHRALLYKLKEYGIGGKISPTALNEISDD